MKRNENENNSSKAQSNEHIKKESSSNKNLDSEEKKLNKAKKDKSNTQEKSNKDNMSDNEPGYKIGQYLIKKTLGKGSFGKVKLGIYLPNKEKVAIKIVDKKKIKEKDDLIRIKREFEMLSKFDHPNIILIVEIFETQKRYYSVMEYCEGGELFNYIVKKRYLCEEEASFFFYQLINGLEYIHSLGIVHRDLKPENLLLTENNLLKIIDFGLSNYHNTNIDLLLGTPCGSPCYASPEMVSGSRYDGYKIDIWSCGIILFAMLCGYLPFEGKENELLFRKILECKVNLPDYLSEEAKDILLKILVKEPDKRYSIQQIKNHPFYLKGKQIFNSNFEIELISFDKKNKKEKEDSSKKDKNEANKNNVIQNIKLNEKEKNKKTKKNNCKKENENNNIHINAMSYLPILTDYENNNSKTKGKQKGKILNELNSNYKYNKNGTKISDIKSKKNKSLNKIKDSFNIFELFQANKKNTNKKLFYKKSNKVFVSKKNFSSGNLIKKLNSFLANKNNYKSNIYERVVLHTDTNYKKKDPALNFINRKVNTNTNTLKNFRDNVAIYKTHLLTDAIKTNINRKLNYITRFKTKTKNNLIKYKSKNQNFTKYCTKSNLLSNIINKCNSKISSKTSESKTKKTNSKSRENVTKLTKNRDNIKSYKSKISNINFDINNINNAGIIDSDYSSYTLKTDPNLYSNKIVNNNKLCNTNHHHSRMTNQSNINKRNIHFQISKQRSIPTLSDFSEFLNRNKLKNDSKKKNVMNFINSDKFNAFTFPKKKNKKNKQNNSINKKNSFFTIRNTMINLNVHTPALLISSYHKIGKKNNLSKKLNSNIRYINFSNYDSESIFLNKANLTNENSNNKDLVNKNEKNNLFKDNNAKTGYNFTIKKTKNRLEYEQFNKQNISNKNHENYNNMKIGNIIKSKNLMIKGYYDKKNIILNQKKTKSHSDKNCNSKNINNEKKSSKKNEKSINDIIN